MLKKLFQFLLLVVAVIAVTAFVFGKTIIASAMTGVIGAPVKIGGLKFGSEVGIYKLEIGSPKGFKEKRIIAIPEASLQMDYGALLKGAVHIKRIKLAMEEATIEKSADGKINLLELKVMKKPETKEGEAQVPETKPEPTGEAKKPAKPLSVQIDEVVLDLNKVRYVDSGQSPSSVKEFDLGVRNESFKDVTSVTSVMKQLVFFILKKVGLSSLLSGVDSLLKDVGGDAGAKLGGLISKLGI